MICLIPNMFKHYSSLNYLAFIFILIVNEHMMIMITLAAFLKRFLQA